MKKKTYLNFIFCISLLGFLPSCGKTKKIINLQLESNPLEQVYSQQEDEGTYQANLLPIHYEKGFQGEGAVEVVVKGDRFVVKTQMNGVEPGIKYYQNIMLNNFCPTLADDKNGDTFIDISEAMNKTGKVLIPLDSNISEQLKGLDYGPIANKFGQYFYKRSTSLTELLIDLRSPDPDYIDSIVKLPLGTNLNLSGKAVLIHGVKLTDDLPKSLGTIKNYKNYEILPIACGILQRVHTNIKP